ncbi:hypothetical protein BD289DRAFT_453415 [Coniella lustricola]|uniref:Myb-like domain-containing protein n=1 Tax=Coniella lustricola TaxID=2025994 RepID=A0A2T3A7B4_9PEZI|nr:hypothetical protein BD289DRAFT_453415 [Coniella lustricola]
MCFQIIPLCPSCEEPAGLGEEIIYADAICTGTCQGDDVCGTTTRRLTQYELELHPDFECLTPGCPRVESLIDRIKNSTVNKNGSANENGNRITPILSNGRRHYRQRRCDDSAERQQEHAEEEDAEVGRGDGGRDGSESGDEDDNNDGKINDEEAEVEAARNQAKQFLRARYQGCLSLCIIPFCEQTGNGGSVNASIQPGCASDSETAVVDSSALAYRAVQKPAIRRGRHSRPWSKTPPQKRGKPWNAEEEAILWKLRRRGMDFDEVAKHIDRTERGCYDRYNKLRNEGYGRGR